MCLICGHETWTSTEMRIHIQGTHGEEEYQRWKTFDWSTFDRKSYKFPENPLEAKVKRKGKSNLDNNFVPEIYKCAFCGNSYTLLSLGAHILKKHREDDLSICQHTCKVCDKDFSSHQELMEHNRNHIKAWKAAECSTCEICGKKCTTRESLKVHNRKVHLKNWPTFCCDSCGKVFYSNYKLQMHKQSFHVDNPFKPFICHVCGKDWLYKGSCKEHIEKVHGPEHWAMWKPPAKNVI